MVVEVAWTGHNKDELNNKKAAATNSYTGGDGKMKRMLEPSIKLIGEVHRKKAQEAGTLKLPFN